MAIIDGLKLKILINFSLIQKVLTISLNYQKTFFENTEIKFITAFALSANNLKRSKN